MSTYKFHEIEIINENGNKLKLSIHQDSDIYE